MSKWPLQVFILFVLLVFSPVFQVIGSNQNAQAASKKAIALESSAGNCIKAQKQKGTDAWLQLTAGGHVLGFRKGEMFIVSGSHALKVEFVNARSVSPVEEGKPSESVKDCRDAPPLGRVTYRDLWDGVSVVYEKTESGVVESTYLIQSGGAKASNPVDEIRLRYNVPVKVDGSGNLVLSFATGEMQETRPVAWQEVAGEKVPVEAGYRLLGAGEVGFDVGAYDPRYPLVIDPLLSWNTFLGGSGDDASRPIAVDTSGNVYVMGHSNGTWGSPVRAYTGGFDATVAKLNNSGVLQWNTFLGGSDFEEGLGIAVDTSGNVYVTGQSNATWGSPVRAYTSSADVFVAKLDGNGVLQWNTFLGGTDMDIGRGIAVDTNGNVYVTGYGNTTWGSPVRAFTAGNYDAIVAKLDGNGYLQWNTFLGGTGDDEGWGIAVDTSGNVCVTTWSNATWGSPVRAYTAGDYDAFVAKLNNSGVLQWNTFLGGTGRDNGFGIAVDTSGNVYVMGTSYATWGSPVRPFTSSADGFVAKLDGSGNKLWNAFLGGTGDDIGYGIAVDASGNIYMTGFSTATWGSPVRAFSGTWDGFVAKISAYYPPPLIFGGHDFDGNGLSDVAVYRPTNGMWYVRNGISQQWGALDDIPVQGCYDANAITDIAIWRPSSGLWFISGIATTQWGTSGDIPVPRDYNGDGITDLAVWRPSNGVWYIKGVGDFQWGQDGDYPVPGDYNGDNIDEIAVWRPEIGVWYISGGGSYQWGAQGDIPVPADYNGDGKTDIAVYRPSTGTWYIQYMGGGTAAVQWGAIADVPVPGDYNGDGTTEIAVFRPSDGVWYIRGNSAYQWGQATDIPLVR